MKLILYEAKKTGKLKYATFSLTNRIFLLNIAYLAAFMSANIKETLTELH